MSLSLSSTPVRTMTGRSFQRVLRRSIFRKVMPSISGIIRSSRMRSGVSLYNIAQPSFPFFARIARKPSYSSSLETDSRASAVSSITRIVGPMRDTSVCAYVHLEMLVLPTTLRCELVYAYCRNSKRSRQGESPATTEKVPGGERCANGARGTAVGGGARRLGVRARDLRDVGLEHFPLVGPPARDRKPRP